MKSWKMGVPLIAALMVASQATAQTSAANAVQAPVQDAEIERRMHEAERQMAEAARQLAELTATRLPNRPDLQRHMQIFGDGGPRLGVMIGGESDGPVKGVEIVGVTPGSAADDAGLRTGDLITAVNGEAMAADNANAASQKLLDFMSGVEVGDTLDLEYLRDGKSGKVQVEPKSAEAQMFAFGFDGRGFGMPGAPGALPAPRGGGPNQHFFEWHSNAGWGDMELVELNAGLGKYFGTEKGLLVVNAPESKALQLEDGDVIQKIDGREPTSVRHALRILGSYQSGETLQLDIMRDRKQMKLKVEVPADMTSGLPPAVPPAARPSRAPSPGRPPALSNAPVEKT